jgi:hypothetical protein
MTHQMSDIVTYRKPWSLRKRMFALAAFNGTGRFVPRVHGLTPVSRCTALYRGFLCVYTVEQDRLFLDTLNIYQDDIKPELFGVLPHTDPNGIYWTSYRALGHPVSFTGGLLIGRDMDKKLSHHAGAHTPAWLYRRVHELVFEDGRLVLAADRSREIARYRADFVTKPISPEHVGELKDLLQWHQDNFTMQFTHSYKGW